MIRTEVIHRSTLLITMDRVDRMNALDADAYADLSDAWTRLRDDQALTSAIVTGAGTKAFCAGADVKSYLPSPEPLENMWMTQRGQLLNNGLEVWKPVIAAVNGYCLGGGMTLLLATDIRVASPNATFGVTEVKRGLVPGNGGTQRMLEQLPYPLAMELLLTGDSIEADTALSWGLINKIVDQDQLMDTAIQYVDRIESNAPLAVQATKELAIRARDLDRSTGLRVEKMFNRLLWCSKDAQEGPTAFAEGRPPRFGSA